MNNAGVWYFSELEMTSDSLLRKVMETNVLGAISLTRALLPQIRQARGRVINVSSLLGKVHYCRKKSVFAWSLRHCNSEIETQLGFFLYICTLI